jgi:Asp-tRNA(Asn)/Glu-tRNA(Gln) amidotransferase B subunit
VKKMAEEILTQPNMNLDKAIGIVMSRVRGKMDPQDVIKIVNNLKK